MHGILMYSNTCIHNTVFYSPYYCIILIACHNLYTCRTDAVSNCTNRVTSCNACYFSNTERPLPAECNSDAKCEGLSVDMMEKCLKKWAECVEKSFNSKYGEVCYTCLIWYHFEFLISQLKDLKICVCTYIHQLCNVHSLWQLNIIVSVPHFLCLTKICRLPKISSKRSSLSVFNIRAVAEVGPCSRCCDLNDSKAVHCNNLRTYYTA